MSNIKRIVEENYDKSRIDLKNNELFEKEELDKLIKCLRPNERTYRIMDKLICYYINKYMAVVTADPNFKNCQFMYKTYDANTKRITVVFLPKNTLQENFRNKYVAILGMKEPQNIFSMWCRSSSRKEYTSVTYEPNIQNIPNTIFNTYNGTLFQIRDVLGTISNNPQIRKKLEFILEFIHMTICAGDEQTFDYLKGFIKTLFVKPWQRINCSLWLCGPQGIGKSTFCNLIGKLMGNDNYVVVDNFDHILKDFNGLLSNRTLVLLEEVNKMRDRELGQFNNLITGENRIQHKKHADHMQVPNYTHFMCCTNKSSAIPMEHKMNRRLFICYSKLKEELTDTNKIKDYFTVLRSYLDDELVLKAIFEYFVRVESNTFDNGSRPPISKEQSMMNSEHLDSVSLWIKDCLERGYHVTQNQLCDRLTIIPMISNTGRVYNQIGLAYDSTWIREVAEQDIKDNYHEFCTRNNYSMLTKGSFWKALLSVCSIKRTIITLIDGKNTDVQVKHKVSKQLLMNAPAVTTAESERRIIEMQKQNTQPSNGGKRRRTTTTNIPQLEDNQHQQQQQQEQLIIPTIEEITNSQIEFQPQQQQQQAAPLEGKQKVAKGGVKRRRQTKVLTKNNRAYSLLQYCVFPNYEECCTQFESRVDCKIKRATVTPEPFDLDFDFLQFTNDIINEHEKQQQQEQGEQQVKESKSA